jgi:hydroxymethylpyrimidine pyrophosphatase-like HAD family hydrolase
MRYVALATDGDGTLIKDNRMADDVAAALERFRAAGGRLFLITGELVKELSEFPRLDLFEQVVAENGAVLFDPATRSEVVLCQHAPALLGNMLRERIDGDVKCGHVVITTKKDSKRQVEEVLAELKLDWQIISNRKDLLVLPEGVDKASGLKALLKKTRLNPKQIVGVGDAENDLALIRACGLGVAVRDAVPQLKAQARLVTEGGAGRGVAELVERIMRDELPHSDSSL